MCVLDGIAPTNCRLTEEGRTVTARNILVNKPVCCVSHAYHLQHCHTKQPPSLDKPHRAFSPYFYFALRRTVAMIIIFNRGFVFDQRGIDEF